MIKKYINSLYEKLEKSNETDKKAEIIFQIIQIKSENYDHTNEHTALYSDIKNFITCYIQESDGYNYGYDIINVSKIINAINVSNNIDEKISLCSYSRRKLLALGYEEEEYKINKLLKELISKLLLKKLKQKKNLYNLYKFLIHKSSYSISSLLAISIILFLLHSLLFLPAPFRFMELYELKYDNYSSSFLTNHVLNFLADSVNISSKFKIIPINEVGLTLLAILKLIYFLIILNFVYKKITDLIYYAK